MKNILTHNNAENIDSSRRSFLNYLLLGSIIILSGQILYPILKYIIPPKKAEPNPTSVIAAKLNELKPNSGIIFQFGNKPGILINTPEEQIRAFTAVCTHLQCTVQYRPDFQHIWCACHNGHFDLHGINIAGPPPRPLEPYKVIINDENIIVAKNT